MSLSELMPSLHELSRSDKVRVVEALVRDLAGELPQDDAIIPIQKGAFETWAWSPDQDAEAAQKLMDYLNEEKAHGRA